jgi:hypothetical protein
MIISVYESRKFDQRTCTDTDGAEFDAILRGESVPDSGIFDDRIAGAMDDFDPQDKSVSQRWHTQDLELDLAVGRIHEEIERRRRILGDAYPFDWNGNDLKYKASATYVYEFCLATTCARTITKGKFVQLPRTFERMAAELVRVFLGYKGEVLHTGWPRDKSAKFKTTMLSLSKLTGEWNWNPQPDLPDEPSGDKDAGVDFVTWKASPDGRPGQLFVLAQCACGDDWERKLHDLALEKVQKWFNPMTYIPAVRAFVTPLLFSDGNLINVQREAGLTFDRARLSLVAEAHPETANAIPMKQLRSLSKMVVGAGA